jgi:hypothetical protein
MREWHDTRPLIGLEISFGPFGHIKQAMTEPFFL